MSAILYQHGIAMKIACNRLELISSSGHTSPCCLFFGTLGQVRPIGAP
jgi:hypothetical protein